MAASKTRDLNKLIVLAGHAFAIVQKTNPFPEAQEIPKRQWDLNQLSDIKKQVAEAIDRKRAYYESTICGRIAKCFLRLFGKWNSGDTKELLKAEDFLIAFDSRMPLVKNGDGTYSIKSFFPTRDASWMRSHLNTQSFYNYNPRRAVPVVVTCQYDALNPHHPYVGVSS